MPTVLIVDDDPKLLKMLQRTLHYESQSLNVFTATNGLEALQLVQVHNPDLIIVDWMMLKMDGLDLVHSLRRVEAKPENQKVSYTDVTLDPSTREAKRGDIKVESELGKGSTVVLQFHEDHNLRKALT